MEENDYPGCQWILGGDSPSTAQPSQTKHAVEKYSKVVKREDIIVMVERGRGFTSKSVNKHDGYEPNHDYLFSINKDRTCM